MQILKTKWFARFARHEGITDAMLREEVRRIDRGLVDADLGGGLIKQRIARKGRGRSGGYRVLLACRLEDRAVFLYGFAKSERENIDPEELLTLREIAACWFSADAEEISHALASEKLQELSDEDEKA